MVDLNKFAQEGRDWIKLEDGGKFSGKYVKVSEGTYETGRAKGKTFITYHFEIDGEIKTFSASSQRLAGKMAAVPFGCTVGIQKFGKGTETVYEVEILKNPSKEQVDDLVEDAKEKLIDPADVKDEKPEGWDE